ncbi:zinc finger, CCHC-type containing protein [Tanacetum coccineum]
MIEAVTDQQLWFWHAYFGVPGANNDLNVLYGSPLFDDLLANKAPEAPFEVNEKTYEKGYYLADEIYPQWATFVKAFTIARDLKTQKFKSVQESARKDVERAFGVLQGVSCYLLKSVAWSDVLFLPHNVNKLSKDLNSKKLFDNGKNRLEQLYVMGEFSDVDIIIEGHGLIARSHKVILGCIGGLCCGRDGSDNVLIVVGGKIYFNMLSVGSSMLNGCGPRTCQWQSVAADIKWSRDMVVDENVSQAIIEHDDAIQHAQEISTKKTPQADGRKNAHQENVAAESNDMPVSSYDMPNIYNFVVLDTKRLIHVISSRIYYTAF